MVFSVVAKVILSVAVVFSVVAMVTAVVARLLLLLFGQLLRLL